MGEASVIAKGEEWLHVRLRRTSKGLRVRINALEFVENHFKEWAGGKVQPVITHGRNWVSDEDPFTVYQMPSQVGVMNFENGMYNLQGVARPLSEPGIGQPMVNLSFLRLVGISRENGVTFYIPGVYDRGMVEDTGRQIHSAAERFYKEFLIPVDVDVVFMSKGSNGETQYTS